MAGIIEIKDKNAKRILTVELAHILDSLEPEGHHLSWTILDLEATGDLGDGKNMLDLEQEIQQSPQGLHLSWDQLISFSRCFFQVINAVIVGGKDSTTVPILQPGGDLYQGSEIVVEAIDSSLWRIYARDEEVLQRFQRTFRDVDVYIPVPAAGPVLPGEAECVQPRIRMSVLQANPNAPK